ncbi:MAG: beta-lactamase family protein [Lentisphaeria bacterium]|nr:beta-lactamase family protein [Lentisphaeria bacterium]
MNRDWTQLRQQLRRILTEEIASGNENACQLTVIRRGETVVDLTAGTEPNALFPIFSAGKPMLATLALLLVERGVLRLDTRVAELWPEFAAPDKREITLEHLLSHRAGMYLLPRSTRSEIADWDRMCRRVAEMSPRTPAGARCRYHPLTFAWLVGHTLELAVGRPLPEMMRDEIIRPLGLQSELYFGTDAEAEARLLPVDDALSPTRPSWLAEMMGDPVLRRCCIPSFNAVASARGVAGFYAGVRGKLLSPEFFDFATGKLFRAAGDPPRTGSWENFALGFVLGGPEADRDMFRGHGGAAGSEGFFMPEADLAYGFVKNRQRTDFTCHPIRDRISEALGIPARHW